MKLTWMLLAVAVLMPSIVPAKDEDEPLADRWAKYWEQTEEEKQGKRRLIRGGASLRLSHASDVMHQAYGGALWVEYLRWRPVIPYATFSLEWAEAKWRALPSGWLTILHPEVGWLLQVEARRLAPYAGMGIGILDVSKSSDTPAPEELPPYDERTRVQMYDLGTDYLVGTFRIGFTFRMTKRLFAWADISYRLAEPRIELVYTNLITKETWIQQENYNMCTTAIVVGMKASP